MIVILIAKHLQHARHVSDVHTEYLFQSMYYMAKITVIPILLLEKQSLNVYSFLKLIRYTASSEYEQSGFSFYTQQCYAFREEGDTETDLEPLFSVSFLRSQKI